MDEEHENCEEGCEFGLVDQFYTDNGELDGLGEQLAFVLGVEWALFRNQLDSNKNPFQFTCNADNAMRLFGLVGKRNRSAAIQAIGSGWCSIEVGGSL